MVYRSRDNLTILELKENEDIISFDKIKDLILERPSNVIYCEKDGRLHSIITMGDVGRACNEGRHDVAVNTKCTKLLIGEYTKAKKIFTEKKFINALPIIDSNGILIGDYSRWNDMAYINMFIKCDENKNAVKGRKIAFIRPCPAHRDKIEIYDKYYFWLLKHGAKVIQITSDEVQEYIGKVEYFLTVNEDEKRALETIYVFMLCRSDLIDRIVSIANLNSVITSEEWVCRIFKSGNPVINLTFCDYKDYCEKLGRDIRSKFAAVGEVVSNRMNPAMYRAFFDDLAEDNYIDSILNIRYQVTNKAGQLMLKDSSSPYYNVLNGERKTVGQPQKYERTIYFIGACFIYGHYVEDKNTIESLIQKKINDVGYKVKVVNYGTPGYSSNIELILARILAIHMKKGDIIVINLWGTIFQDAIFPYGDKVNLYSVLAQNDVSASWFVDAPIHCNHKVNVLFADAIFEKLKPIISEKVEGQGELIEYEGGDYIKILYINRYFSSFDQAKYDKIGSIVMNCNPFTYGHRYLIDQALEIVDFLIIFVVEEDKSYFPFDERFAMVCEGVEDLENVLAVPSGPFILSQTSFPEYFIKTADEDLAENVDNDVKVFAEKIAPHLNIKYRFVGEEPEDKVTNEYNLAMKRILPQNGIELVEIPRMKIDGRYISASRVRECLASEKIAELKRLVPQSTMNVLFGD